MAGVSVAAGDLLAVAYLAWWDGSRDFARVEYAVELLFRQIGYVLQGLCVEPFQSTEYTQGGRSLPPFLPSGARCVWLQAGRVV